MLPPNARTCIAPLQGSQHPPSALSSPSPRLRQESARAAAGSKAGVAPSREVEAAPLGRSVSCVARGTHHRNLSHVLCIAQRKEGVAGSGIHDRPRR